VAKADATKDPDLKAKAHFNLGAALIVSGKYPEGIKEIAAANATEKDDDWSELMTNAAKWQKEAQRYEAQVALGKVEEAAPTQVAAAEPAPAEPELIPASAPLPAGEPAAAAAPAPTPAAE